MHTAIGAKIYNIFLVKRMPTPHFDNPLKFLAKKGDWYNIEQVSVNFRKCMHECDSSAR